MILDLPPFLNYAKKRIDKKIEGNWKTQVLYP